MNFFLRENYYNFLNRCLYRIFYSHWFYVCTCVLTCMYAYIPMIGAVSLKIQSYIAILTSSRKTIRCGTYPLIVNNKSMVALLCLNPIYLHCKKYFLWSRIMLSWNKHTPIIATNKCTIGYCFLPQYYITQIWSYTEAKTIFDISCFLEYRQWTQNTCKNSTVVCYL